MLTEPPQIKRHSKLKSKKQVYRLLPAPIGLRDMNEASSCSLTSSDMAKNAGAGSRAEVRAARVKVKAYGEFSRTVITPTVAAFLDDETVTFTE